MIHFENEITVGFGSKCNNKWIGIGITSWLIHYAWGYSESWVMAPALKSESEMHLDSMCERTPMLGGENERKTRSLSMWVLCNRSLPLYSLKSTLQGSIVTVHTFSYSLSFISFRSNATFLLLSLLSLNLDVLAFVLRKDFFHVPWFHTHLLILK